MTEPNTDIPLIHTLLGNVPVASLVRQDGWDIDRNGITYWEQYLYEGEVVKRNAARFQLPDGQTIEINQGVIGG